MLIPKFYTEVVYYVLLPIFVIILLFGIFILVVSRKDSLKKDLETRFKLNYWSSIMGIILGSILLTVSIGYSVALIQKIYVYELTNVYPVVLAILYIFPIVPLVFVIFCIVRFIKVLKHRNEIIVEVE